MTRNTTDMQLIHSERKIIARGNILTISFQHGNNSHAIIVTDGDPVSIPLANKVIVKIDDTVKCAHVEMDNKGHYTCVFPSIETYRELVQF